MNASPLRHAAALVVAGLLIAASPAAARKPAPKPSIKVLGLSINSVYAHKGSTIKAGDSTNSCYIIGGGPSGEPRELKVYAYVHATKIPPKTPLTYEFKTPWDKLEPAGSMFSGPFSSGLFKAHGKQQAELSNGPTGKHDYFTYRMLPTGTPASYYISGKYSLSVTVKVNGKTLTSRGTVTVAC